MLYKSESEDSLSQERTENAVNTFRIVLASLGVSPALAVHFPHDHVVTGTKESSLSGCPPRCCGHRAHGFLVLLAKICQAMLSLAWPHYNRDT